MKEWQRIIYTILASGVFLWAMYKAEYRPVVGFEELIARVLATLFAVYGYVLVTMWLMGELEIVGNESKQVEAATSQ